MGLASTATKCLLTIINAGMAASGLLLIALATITLPAAPPVYSFYLYIVGSVSFLAALLGCCAICREEFGLTLKYAIIILSSLVAQVIAVIHTSDPEVVRSFASDVVEKTWLEEIQHPGAMNKTQQTFYCCGKNDYSDYLALNRSDFPISCYPSRIGNSTHRYPYANGCSKAARDNFNYIFNYLSPSEWVHLALTSIAFVFAVYLIVLFRCKQRRYNY